MVRSSPRKVNETLNYGDVYREKPDTRNDTTLVLISDLMIGQYFVGNYLHRTFVSSINKYRDEITVDSTETTFLSNLKFAQKHLSGSKLVDWRGFHYCEEDGHPKGTLFVPSMRSLPFGRHSFMIQNVQVLNGELAFTLKVMPRPQETELDRGKNKPAISADGDTLMFLAMAVVEFLKKAFTLTNIKETSRFLMTLTVMLIGTLLEIFQLLLSATISIVRIFPRYITAIMPLLLAIVDAWNKLIGGLYILIWAMYRGDAPNQRPPMLALAARQTPVNRHRPMPKWPASH